MSKRALVFAVVFLAVLVAGAVTLNLKSGNFKGLFSGLNVSGLSVESFERSPFTSPEIFVFTTGVILALKDVPGSPSAGRISVFTNVDDVVVVVDPFLSQGTAVVSGQWEKIGSHPRDFMEITNVVFFVSSAGEKEEWEKRISSAKEQHFRQTRALSDPQKVAPPKTLY